jgi:hypothetical protein
MTADSDLKPSLQDTVLPLPKPVTSGMEARGRFGKQDFVYLSDEDVYRCPAGERLKYHYSNEEDGQRLRRYWTNACRDCALKPRCTSGKERRITRWEHEHVLEVVQKRLDKNPQAMRVRRETVEHTFGTLKMRMGATHFLMKRLPKVASEMALHVLAYNLTRVMNIMGIQPSWLRSEHDQSRGNGGRRRPRPVLTSSLQRFDKAKIQSRHTDRQGPSTSRVRLCACHAARMRCRSGQPPNLGTARLVGAEKSMRGPAATMPVGLMVRWLP